MYTRLPRPPRTPVDEDGESVLQLTSVDILIAENGQDHHTYDYELMERPEGAQLVVRRGQSFHLQLGFNRDFEPETDAISFIFSVVGVEQPSPSNKTCMAIPVLNCDGSELEIGWWARIVETNESSAKVQVCTLATSIVGVWKLHIDTKFTPTGCALSYTMPERIYLLFNPWCPDDTVYMEDDDWKNEYVMADSGLIWRGSPNQLHPCPWNFAQFEKDILDCSLYLLSTIGKITVAGRADPIRVVRVISAALNSSDDNGVLEGNWSGDYTGGTEPTKWQGSMLILQKYWNTKTPVKYGQCWVFSGLTTTVCRALGIPARSVTNFSSAHDHHGNLTIDTIFDQEGKVMKDLKNDSIWNYHVWNEVWMERPDLEPGNYGGWQAIDATPQEESDGVYRCGPSSLAAIKRGEVKKPYDTAFQFAEVNADQVNWKFTSPTTPLKLFGKSTNGIGKFISTKAVGLFEREDITDSYKHEEGSDEERQVVLKALLESENTSSRYYLNEVLEDIHFHFQLLDEIVVGSPINVVLTAINGNSERDYNIQAVLRLDSILYTGKHKNFVKNESFEIVVEAGSEQKITMTVPYEEYAPELGDQSNFKMACLAKVDETDYEFFAQDDFRASKPDIVITAPEQVQMGEEFEATLTFVNPLPVELNNGKFVIEGAGLGQPHKVRLSDPVEPEQEVSVVATISTTRLGQKTLVAKFYSDELKDVDGYWNLEVVNA